MPLQATPEALPDARRLHGYTTPGGIIWRNLSDPKRPAWNERNAGLYAELERALALTSLDRDAQLAPEFQVAAGLVTKRRGWAAPDSRPVDDIDRYGKSIGVDLVRPE